MALSVAARTATRPAQTLPRFSAQQPAQVDPTALKLTRYRHGWLNLIQWDQAHHAVPVLETVRMDRLMTSARTFLQRQAHARPSGVTPFLIGIAGGSASGKSTIKNAWMKAITTEAPQAVGWKPAYGPLAEQLEMDNYYRDFSAKRKQLGDEAFFTQVDLDRPEALDWWHLQKDVFRLKNGRGVWASQHTFSDSRQIRGRHLKVPAPLVMVDGMFALAKRRFRNLLDMTVFISADTATRTARWWNRAPERNLMNDKGKALFARVMQNHDTYVEPQKAHADVVINSAAPLADVQEIMRRLAVLLLRTFYPVDHRGPH